MSDTHVTAVFGALFAQSIPGKLDNFFLLIIQDIIDGMLITTLVMNNRFD